VPVLRCDVVRMAPVLRAPVTDVSRHSFGRRTSRLPRPVNRWRRTQLETNCSRSDFLTERQLLPKLTLTFASGWSTSEADVTPKSSIVRSPARRTGPVDPEPSAGGRAWGV